MFGHLGSTNEYYLRTRTGRNVQAVCLTMGMASKPSGEMLELCMPYCTGARNVDGSARKSGARVSPLPGPLGGARRGYFGGESASGGPGGSGASPVRPTARAAPAPWWLGAARVPPDSRRRSREAAASLIESRVFA